MKHESILKVIKEYEDTNEQWAKDLIIKNLKTEIEKVLILEAAKATGGISKKNRITAVLNYIKQIDNTIPNIKGSFYTEGKQSICNGYSAIILNEELEGIPKIPEHIEAIKIKDFFDGAWNDTEFTVKASEIAAHYKIAKAEAGKTKTEYTPKGRYKIGDQIFDISLLLETTKILGDCTIKIKERAIDPILFESEVGKAIVLPLRP
jgi:hypothetical protein